MNSRERAEKLFGREGKFSFWGLPGREQAIDDVEVAFREIRNEALEEAVGILEQQRFGEIETDIRGLIYLIRALKAKES